MPYAPIAYPPESGIDYRAKRPFMNWQRPRLLASIEGWLSLDPPKLELATLALEELKTRGSNRARPALMLFNKAGLQPIPWLAAARNIVLKDLPESTTARGRGRLYVILRDGYTAANGSYGAYVGVTCRPVNQRFVQHRTGIRAARGLPEHGIELLHSLFLWANPIPGDRRTRIERETNLHKLLEQIVPRVGGDVCSSPRENISLDCDPINSSAVELGGSSSEMENGARQYDCAVSAVPAAIHAQSFYFPYPSASVSWRGLYNCAGLWLPCSC